MNTHARSFVCAAMMAIGLATLSARLAASAEHQESGSPPQAADSAAAAPRAPHQAVELALDFMVKDAAKWRAEHGCVTCHHGTMTVWALSEAKNQGYLVGAVNLEETTWETKTAVVRRFSKPREPGIQLITSAFYLGIMSQNLPILTRDEMRLLAEHLARFQEEDGTWELRNQEGSGLPPTSESRETIVLLGLLAWEPHILASPLEAAKAHASREKAVAWLRDNQSTDTLQAIALRLLLDVRSGKPPEQLQPGIDRLLSLQNTDGGWRQLPEMPSDAYATGQTLWVLSFAGVRPDHSEVVRAVSYLVASQRADGSWPMPFRSHPDVPATRERGPIPITYFGSAWATLGLVRMVPPILDPAMRHKRALDMIVAINGRVERDEADPAKPVTSAFIGHGPYDDDDLAKAMVHLTAFPQLKSLKMKFSKLTDAGLLQLQPLSQLEDLSLETSAITDEGLGQLKGFSQLKTLNLKGTKVTDAGVQALQQALPNVKVER